jgi:hypothetical protein
MRRMGLLRKKTGLIPALALVSVLFWAQSVVLQHGFHHFDAGDSGPCAACSVGNGLDGLAGADQPATPLAVNHYGYRAAPPAEVPAAFIRSTHIRAPPSSSAFL